MTEKTNAVRMVVQSGIPCQVRSYTWDESDLSGIHAAAALGMPPEQVFKTLVARGTRTGVCVFCIPVNRVLDLKKAAKVSGDKHVELVPLRELLSLTGYVRGGCSPVGMKHRYPTYLDQSARDWPEIWVSAGQRGQQMLLPPECLAQLTGAQFAELTT